MTQKVKSRKQQKAELDKVVKREGVPDLDCEDCGKPKLAPDHKCNTNGSMIGASVPNQQSLETYFTEFAHLTNQRIISIDVINDILQLRNKRNESHVDYLARDIERFGLKNAIDVVENEDGTLMVIDGDHRIAAFRKLEYKDIKANILKSTDVFERKVSAYLANVNRLEYSTTEHARILSDLYNDALIKDASFSMERFAKETLNQPISTVKEYLRISKLAESVIEKIEIDWPKKRALAMKNLSKDNQGLLIDEFYNNDYSVKEIKDKVNIWNNLSDAHKTDLFAGDESWDSLSGIRKEVRSSGTVVYHDEKTPDLDTDLSGSEYRCTVCGVFKSKSELHMVYLDNDKFKDGMCKECHHKEKSKQESGSTNPLDFEIVDRTIKPVTILKHGPIDICGNCGSDKLTNGMDSPEEKNQEGWMRRVICTSCDFEVFIDPSIDPFHAKHLTNQSEDKFQCISCKLSESARYMETNTCINCHREYEQAKDSNHTCFHCNQAVEQQSDLQQLEKKHDDMLEGQVVNNVIDQLYDQRLGPEDDHEKIPEEAKEVEPIHISHWADKFETTHDVYNHSSEVMHEIKDNSVHLVNTSPPYNSNQEYGDMKKNEDSRPWVEYDTDTVIALMAESFRILVPGGRLAINVANLMRPNMTDPNKQFLPLNHLYRQRAIEAGFIQLGEVIWYKNANLPTAWGSYMKPSLPHIRDSHEFVLIFSKPRLDENNIPWLVSLEKPDIEDINDYKIPKAEFHTWTQSIWEITPASSKDHPCIFPPELVRRLISLYTYPSQIVADPFGGSGTTAAVAKELLRSSISYEIEGKYMSVIADKIMNVDVAKWFHKQAKPLIEEDLDNVKIEEGSS